jgi:hypothetical protein
LAVVPALCSEAKREIAMICRPDPDDRPVRFRAAAAAGFTLLPNPILKSRKLTPTAKIVYGLLRCYAWQDDHAFPGQDRLAPEVPCSAGTLIKGLRELQNAGLITIERRGLTRSNVYWLEPLDDPTLASLK